jgi:carbonic anhydrase/acetyltransferase-like protein (isoleucine patch superfamily)
MLYALDNISPTTAGNYYVSPGASVIGDVHLGEDTSVWFGAVLRGDVEHIEIGRGSNIQDGSVLHTDPGAPLVLEEYVTIGHMVMLHGCRIGKNSLVGIGSTILNHATVGKNSIVGAHTLVTEGKSFPDGVLILGTPAKVARELTEAEIAGLPTYASRYMKRAERYRTALTRISD